MSKCFPLECTPKTRRGKSLLASGIDPSQQAKLDKIEKQESNSNTFSSAADEFLAKVEREGRADATMRKKRWLFSLALPDLGQRPIAEISAAEILVPLRKVKA